MRNCLKILGVLMVLITVVQPTLAGSFSIHVVHAYTGRDATTARVDICDSGGNMIEWGYTDRYGDYQTNLYSDEDYLIKASLYSEYGSKRIHVDMFTPNTIDVSIG
jgi:hypothetical protein